MKEILLCDKCNVQETRKSPIMPRYETRCHYLCDPCGDKYSEVLTLAHDNFIQPERSKREDLDCCKRLKILESFDKHNDDCFSHQCDVKCLLIDDLIQEYKMRCSEHCG